MKFVVALGVLALAIVAQAGVSMNNPFFCYMTDPIRSMTNMHATSTSYEAIRRFNFTTFNPYLSTCSPDRFWYLGREGGRFPPAATMQAMIDFAESSIQEEIETNYDAGRTTLCRQDFEAIRDWTRPTNFVMPNAAMATAAGVEAMQNIARRFQQVMPEILTPEYDRTRFHFRHTWSERTNTSIRAFATGLFGEAGAQNVVYEPVPERDWFMRPFDFCPAFTNDTAGWPLPREAFRLGPEIQEMLVDINRKLGFLTTGQLSFDEIFTMWEWCRYELSSTFEFSDSPTGEDSVWCAPFSVADHLLLEYFEDLGHFHFSCYGVPNQRLLENMNCGLLVFLLNERPILVPGCDQQTGVCKLNTFLQQFPRFRDANCEQFFCSME